MGEFFNPYNFVPTPPRTGDFPRELSDAPPVGHHRLHDDRWNGTIAVRMTAVSPLLVPSGRVDVDGQKHKTKQTRTVDGQVVIPPSSVKGMIRSAFESVTNSRFGEFAKRNREPLAFRQTAREGIEAFPATVTPDGKIRVLMGDVPFPERPAQSGYAQQTVITAAWVLSDDLDRNEMRHGDFVGCKIDERHHSNGFGYLRVTEVEKLNESELPRWGRVYRTGVTELNRGRKHYERVFLMDGKSDPTFELTDDLRTRWRRLIADAREQHQDETQNFADYVQKSSGLDEWAELVPGSMMYLRIKWDSSARRWVIDEVQPVAISRQLHPDSPEALLHPSLRPPTAPSEFSPAEHVFGWVHADGKDAKSSGYAGSVRFGPVVCTSDNAIEKFDQPNTLPILDRPKPEQSRFYLGVSKNGTVVPFDKKMSKQEIRYAAGSGRALRGRKVYPTQNRQPKRTNNQRGKQNQSYHDQVRAGTEFRFEVNVRNLSSSELGALLTVLDLDNAVNDGTHRHLGFGGAKPLGYGSVSTVVDWPRSNLRSGTEDTLAFCELRAPQPDNESARATVADFVSLVSGRPFFEAFKIATKGYGSDVPVHYPRVEPSTGDANKDTLEWFMVNESDRELRHPLPPLSANRDGKMTTHAPRSRGGGPRRR